MIEFATIARPYAKAIFELAESEQADNWQTSLKEAAWLVRQPQVEVLIAQTDTDAKQKADMLIDLLGDSPALGSYKFKNFLYVLAQEKRLPVLPEIYEQFKELVLSRKHIRQAVVYTAYDIADENQKQQIIQDLEQHFQTKLQAVFETDRDLIGGIKAVVGDQVLDLSVQGKLQKLYATMNK